MPGEMTSLGFPATLIVMVWTHSFDALSTAPPSTPSTSLLPNYFSNWNAVLVQLLLSLSSPSLHLCAWLPPSRCSLCLCFQGHWTPLSPLTLRFSVSLSLSLCPLPLPSFLLFLILLLLLLLLEATTLQYLPDFLIYCSCFTSSSNQGGNISCV